MENATKPLVIFGTGQIAEVAWFYFTHDSAYKPVAFTVDRAFRDKDSLLGLPVIPFDELPQSLPPAQADLFVALSYTKLNSIRKQKVQAVRAAGYSTPSYISSRATTFDGFEPGGNCFILEDNTIQPFCQIGDNVTLWSGNHIGHHAVIEDNCFISSHVVISGGVRVGDSSFLGVNSTVRDHVSIGARCVIGAGSLIIADTEPEGVYTSPPSERSRVPSTRLRGI